MLQTAKQVGTPSEDTTRGSNAAAASGNSTSCQELAAQDIIDAVVRQSAQTGTPDKLLQKGELLALKETRSCASKLSTASSR